MSFHAPISPHTICMGPIKSIAVCAVRDAEDIIAFSVLHHLLAGMEINHVGRAIRGMS